MLEDMWYWFNRQQAANQFAIFVWLLAGFVFLVAAVCSFISKLGRR